MTAESDTERTAVIQAVDAPLPPYAAQHKAPYEPVPMSANAPTPPPPGQQATHPQSAYPSYPQSAYPQSPYAPSPYQPSPYAQPAEPQSAQPEPAQPQSVADAMVEISMPPLAAPAATIDAPAPPPRQEIELSKPEPPAQVPDPAPATQAFELPGAETHTVEPQAVEPVEPQVGELVEPQVVELVEPQALEPVAEPALPAPASTTAAIMPPPASEVITCPECGTTANVTLNRRESMDFCRNCDYPLFWTPSKVLRGPSGTTDESLRRLPGQAGRVTVASLPCPFCYEPNALSAQTCIRCQRPMHPVEEAPAPEPVYLPPPEPVVVEAPTKVAWWVWALLAVGAVALITLVVLIGTGVIG